MSAWDETEQVIDRTGHQRLKASRPYADGYDLMVLDWRRSARPVRWYVLILQGCRCCAEGDAATLEEGLMLAEWEALRRCIWERGGP